ncbi:MAG: pyridoxamine kinase [Clostridia bacterium]|nr:pyridoxamine kinase [Clostridia bacterium]
MNGKILTMQDVSCMGQCSMTVALPILSHFGIETVILPTAILSNHTMFKTWSYLDLTPELPNIFKGWEDNGFTFDGFLLGYLGKKEIMDAAKECFSKFSSKNAPVIIDPAFGDMGKLYGGFDEAYVESMRGLIKSADIIIPNLTEVCFLAGCEYKEIYDKEYLEACIKKLSALTGAKIIVTGVEFGDGLIGEAVYEDGKIDYTFEKKLDMRSHGTGDIFAAVFAAYYFSGHTLVDACRKAGQFVAVCINNTEKEHSYGVRFEKALAPIE